MPWASSTESYMTRWSAMLRQPLGHGLGSDLHKEEAAGVVEERVVGRQGNHQGCQGPRQESWAVRGASASSQRIRPRTMQQTPLRQTPSSGQCKYGPSDWWLGSASASCCCRRSLSLCTVSSCCITALRVSSVASCDAGPACSSSTLPCNTACTNTDREVSATQ